jgi:CDP-diglyceride synthetase
MYFLLAMPGSSEWFLVLVVIALIVGVPIIAYFAGFRNGRREGERLQLQKQVDERRAL